MTDNTKNSYYQLSLNILKALGGDTSISFPDADAIWDEIYKIYDHSGGRFDIVPLEKTITENGQYDYYPDNNADAFMPVNLTINVPQKYTDEQVAEIENVARQDGYNTGYSSGFIQGETEGYNDGFSEGLDEGYSDGVIAQKEKLESITLTDNGTYTKEDGWDEVIVEVEGVIPDEELQQMLQDAMDEGYQDGYSEGVDDGREEQKQELESVTFRENGTYTREDGWNSVTVEVAGSGGTGKPKIYNGFRFSGNNVAGSVNAFRQIDFSQYDWSDVYDTGYFFANFCKSSSVNDGWVDADFENFRQHYNGKMLNCNNLFFIDSNNANYGALLELPNFGDITNGCCSMTRMCYSQKKMTSADNIAKWNTKSVVCMNEMFDSCIQLTEIPLFDTSNVTNMNKMFNACTALISIPQFDTSNVTNMSYMFGSCGELTSIPQLDMSKVTTISSMFYGCTKLTELPDCNTKSMQTWSNWLPSKVQKVGIIDCDSTTNVQGMLTASDVLTEMGGFRNLGILPSVSNTNSNYFLYNVPNLTYESLINIFNLLYDRASAGYSVLTLKLAAAQMNKLSDDDKAIAINKGWSLTV